MYNCFLVLDLLFCLVRMLLFVSLEYPVGIYQQEYPLPNHFLFSELLYNIEDWVISWVVVYSCYMIYIEIRK